MSAKNHIHLDQADVYHLELGYCLSDETDSVLQVKYTDVNQTFMIGVGAGGCVDVCEWELAYEEVETIIEKLQDMLKSIPKKEK